MHAPPDSAARARLARPGRPRLQRRLERLTPWLFVLPAFLVYVAFVIGPMCYSAVLSLYRWDGISPVKTFVGLKNYHALFFVDGVFWTALKNNVIWAACAIVVPNGVGLALALVLNRPFRGRTLFRGIFYFPSVLSLVLVGLIWSWLYHPTFGLINEVLRSVGLGSWARYWLSDTSTALYAAFVAAAWQSTALPMILYLAGLQNIPSEAIESARVEGAGTLALFRYITFPLLRETTMVVLAITIIGSLGVYDIIYTMTYGGPADSTEVLAVYMYFHTYIYNNVGFGTAIAVVLFLLTMVFAVPYVLYMSRDA